MSRVVDAHLADACMDRIDALEEEVDAVLTMEKEERAMGEAERDVRKGENLVEFEAEIKSRPKRTWFATEREKGIAKERGRKELNGAAQQADITDRTGPEGRQSKKKVTKRKLSNKQKKALDAKKEIRERRAWKKGKGMGGSAGTAKTKTKGKPPEKPKAKFKVKVKEGRGGEGSRRK